jgi:pyruvyltransferase
MTGRSGQSSGADAIKFMRRSRNWGDYVAPYIYRKLTGRRPKTIDMFAVARERHYLTVGSVLRMADANSIVWGTGFVDHDDGIGLMRWGPSANERLAVPARVCAVRGKLTRKKLLAFGIECPEVYGDPALLMPLFYRPPARKRYELGFVPHYTDLDRELVKRLQGDRRVHVVSMVKSRVEQVVERRASYERVVDALLQCERVISGSLHGLILAEAYGIPCEWVQVGDRNIGDGFKYLDFFSSVGRSDVAPLVLDDGSQVNRILADFPSYAATIDTAGLLRSCPFYRPGAGVHSSSYASPRESASAGP